jgi:hypothetical protein
MDTRKPMKLNSQSVGSGVAGTQVNESMCRLARGLLACVHEFDHDSGPPLFERLVRLSFANGVYLAIQHPEALVTLVPELHAAGVTGGREAKALLSGFEGFDSRNWLASAGDIVTGVWRSGDRDADDHVRHVLFAVFAGIAVGAQLPDVAKAFEGNWGELNCESRFLASRLNWWRENDWKPAHAPFVEFAAGFYETDSVEQRVLAGAMREMLVIARSFSNPWELRLWAESGWFAGRKLSAESPEVRRELFGDVPPDELATYFDLYARCVIATAAGDGTVRPERAALRYFGTTAKDVYARALCCGDQPRYIARSAYDLTFWMGLLSTQQMPVPAGADGRGA